MSRRALASAAATLVVAQAACAVALTAAAGWSPATALDAFVVSNCVLGLSFGLCGAFVAWHRPENPVGWLLAVAGVLHLVTAVGAPAQQVLVAADQPTWLVRTVATVTAGAWPWSIALLVPLFLLLFPDGRWLSPAWRWLAGLVALTAPLFVASALAPEPIAPGLPTPHRIVPDHDGLDALWVVAEVRTLAALVLGLAALVVRYRREDEQRRQQILWLLLAVSIVIAFITPWSLVAGTPVFVLFSIPLVPVAVAIAIVRHQLLDIRLVVARVVVFALLSTVVVASYVALVWLLDSVVSERLGRSAVATVVVALVAAPVLPRLHRWVERLVYGDRRDPVRVISTVGEHLASDDRAGLPGVVASIAAAMRLPYVAVRADGAVVAAAGVPGPLVEEVALTLGGEPVGDLVVGLRHGEHALAPADRNALALVAASLAVALHATSLSAELRTSRDRLAATREAERGRLRRDLHDGLGPHLTGVALKADAARNLLTTDPALAEATLAALASDTRSAIAEVRRVVDDLRPAALDDVGLVDALRTHVAHLADVSPLKVELTTRRGLPALPHDVEVAAYRVATEALNNVVRHAGARSAAVRVDAEDSLEVEVTDDGPSNARWTAGVGLQAMAARAAELGGSFEAGPAPTGGRVLVTFPLRAS